MTIRFGVIGAGMIGKDHARRITNILTGGKIVAVNDVNPEQAKGLVDTLGIDAEIYQDPYALISSDTVDAVMVTSWGPTHEDFVLAAIAAGKYVFCEKPLATTAAGCRKIVDAEIAHGKKLVQVGYMRRYDRGYRLLKKSLDEGLIGEPLMLHCAHRNPAVDENYLTTSAIEDTLIHELDVLRWLINDDYKTVQVVFPKTTKYSHSKLADPQIILIETQSGVRIDVEVFVNCKYGYDIQCSVVGEEGVANLPEPQSLLTRQSGKLASSILQDWKQRFIDAYDVELQEFIEDAVSGRLRGPNAWDGFSAAVASDACILAQQSGEIVPVSMPDKPDFYN